MNEKRHMHIEFNLITFKWVTKELLQIEILKILLTIR